MTSNKSRFTLRAAVFAAVVAFAGSAMAQAGGAGGGGGSFPGDTNERATGFPCLTPQCDVVRLPDSNCLCQILNPSNTDRDKVELKCTIGGTSQMCPQQPN